MHTHVHAHHTHIIHIIIVHTPYTNHIHIIHTPYTHHIHTIYTSYTHHIHTIYTPYIHYTHCTHAIHTHTQTYIGSVIVSVNPYKQIGIYDNDTMEEYRGVNFYELSPHM